jgi:acyl-CoA thioesterase II
MDALNLQDRVTRDGKTPPEWDGKDVADLLGLAQVSESRFRSQCSERNENGRIYGGQILGQALSAAVRTVSSDRFASCVQLLFAAGGLPDQPIDFEVATVQEGKRFSSRNVRGVQDGGRILCDASVAFARAMGSPAHDPALSSPARRRNAFCLPPSDGLP